MKKQIISFVSVIAFLFSFCTNFSSPVRVSALSSDGLIYSAENSNISLDSMKSVLSQLYDNPSLSDINLANSVIYLHFFGSSSVRVVILPNYTTVKSSTSDGNFTYYFPFSSSYVVNPYYGDELSISSLPTYNFVPRTTSREYSFVGINDNYLNISNTDATLCGFTAYSRQPNFNGSVPTDYYPYIGSNFICYLPDPVYNPVITPLYEAVYSLNIQKEEFIKWLIDNERYVDIADGLVENRVSGFVDIFQKYGANSKAFGFNVKQFFDFLGIGQTISDYGSVLEKTRSLYREYQKSVRLQLMEHYNNKVKDTLNIKPVTNDNNVSLITDTDSDTVVIRLLRDILRSLISLPVSIGDLIRSLEVKFDGLDNSVIITNDGGLSTDFSILWTYNNNDFDDDLINFSLDVADVQQLPLQYLTNINENPLMPEKMLKDKDNLTVNIPNISGFTVSDSGKSFSTQTTSYVISSNDYPWLDPLVKKIKRFSGILLIVAYLVSLRYRFPEIVRGE